MHKITAIHVVCSAARIDVILYSTAGLEFCRMQLFELESDYSSSAHFI
jgi:hypothetical protein